MVGMLNSRRSYQSIGEHFGVTRQRVHQMAEALRNQDVQIRTRSPRGAGRRREKKVDLDPISRVRRKRANPGSPSAKNALGIYKVFTKLRSLGLKVEMLANENDPVDLIVNGLAVAVAVRNKSRKVTPGTKTRYFTFQLSSKQKECADFVVCSVAPRDSCYVIPMGKVRKGGCIYIPDVDGYSGAYSEFENAWHLLETRRGE